MSQLFMYPRPWQAASRDLEDAKGRVILPGTDATIFARVEVVAEMAEVVDTLAKALHALKVAAIDDPGDTWPGDRATGANRAVCDEVVAALGAYRELIGLRDETPIEEGWAPT